jgi:hypothetical protein
MLNFMSDPLAALQPIIDYIMANLVIIIVLVVVQLLVGVLMFKVALGWMKAQNTKFGPVLLTYILGNLISIIPCLGCILAMVITKKRHEIGFWSSVAAWLIGGILASLASYLVSLVVGGAVLAGLMDLITGLIPMP